MFQPTVGPIVGHTTPHHTRLFIRGGSINNEWTYAAVRYRRRGDTDWSAPLFAELSALRDFSNVIALNNLGSDTRYEYQAGWFSSGKEQPSEQTLLEWPLQWPKQIYQLRTISSEVTTPRSYIVGSCRYLRMTLGIPSYPSKGDKIFSAIHNLVKKNALIPVGALVMTGDQIYVDDMNVVSPDREYKEILAKYRAAFSQPHIQALMASVPTYMILDDHEIEDNWPANANNDVALYRNAMAAYEIYQASHSPVHELLPSGQPARKLEHYWYQFAQGDIEWFVTDSRTRRDLSANDRRILDAEQEDALISWLINSPARVKFLVTSVMFFPDNKDNGTDAWKAFPEQRLRILDTIRKHRIKNVIVVTGDVHGSLTSRLRHSEDADFEVQTIVSSPFCNSALLPYASASSFILDQPLAQTESGDYHLEWTSKVISQDNFAYLEVEREHIRVEYRDRDGEHLYSVNLPLQL